MEGQSEGQTTFDTPRVAVVSEALTCDICGATTTKHGDPFKKPQQVAMHKARAHAGMGPGGRNGSKKKKFACPIAECERSYGRYNSLTHHLREDHHTSITEFPELLKPRAKGGKHYSKREKANLAAKSSAAPPIRIVADYNDTPRLSQFLREREAVEQALAYVQTTK